MKKVIVDMHGVTADVYRIRSFGINLTKRILNLIILYES